MGATVVRARRGSQGTRRASARATGQAGRRQEPADAPGHTAATRAYLAATWAYVAATVAAAAVVIATAPVGSYSSQWWGIYATLAALFLLFNSAATQDADGQSAWSPCDAAALAAVVLLGAPGAAMVGAIGLLGFRRMPLAVRLFSAGSYALAGYAAGVAYKVAHGPAPLAEDHHLPSFTAGSAPVSVTAAFSKMLVPFAVAAITGVLLSYGLLWGRMLLDRRSRPVARRAITRSNLPLMLLSDLGFAALGLVIAALWVVMGPFAVAIVLVPLFVARWAIGQIAAQQRAHSAALAALCQAVETKDFYTRGHSERVSRGAGMIARQIRLGPARAQAVAVAGMLHDVGKLGVPTRVLQKEGLLTEEEFAAIAAHPTRGLEIVEEIGFLAEALTGILHHHERVDGRGYPMGFAGEEIPLFARIIAVADAFDSITSTRSYRGARPVGEATAELRKGAGSQFDPWLVDAFITALGREGWPAHDPGRPGSHEIVASTDHDDPMSPPRVGPD